MCIPGFTASMLPRICARLHSHAAALSTPARAPSSILTAVTRRACAAVAAASADSIKACAIESSCMVLSLPPSMAADTAIRASALSEDRLAG
jgi:hypothetical protein